MIISIDTYEDWKTSLLIKEKKNWTNWVTELELPQPNKEDYEKP